MSARNLAIGPQLPRVAAIIMAFALAVSALGACSDNEGTNDIAGPTKVMTDDDEGDNTLVYDQVEFLGNPLVSEVTIMKANHDAYNRTQPYNTATFGPQSLAFINAFRGGQPAVANTIGAVLYPDMLPVESSRNPATAGWLSWALAAGWGGRKVPTTWSTRDCRRSSARSLPRPGQYCDNFTLPLCTDNVGANDKAFSSTFPYLAPPTTP